MVRPRFSHPRQALAAALFLVLAPSLADAACSSHPGSGRCVHPGAACAPPKHGACQTVARPIPIPGPHKFACLCGVRGRPILLP